VTTSADRRALVVVDTNVLLSATDRSRSAHESATRFLNHDERRLALTPQIVREYLAVATRPVEANGFGLSGQEAVTNVQQLLEDMELLSEAIASTNRLTDLVGGGVALGKQGNDANIVAVALAHGASTIVTDDARHFARFDGVIAVEALPSPPD
jgi:predicted nucleic acid-binding protein